MKILGHRRPRLHRRGPRARSCALLATRSTGWTPACTRAATFGGGPGAVDERPRDIRAVHPRELEGYDAVVCLAALSNDPLGQLNPASTFSINLHGTLHLARAAKAAGVPRFVFASSCSLYGAAGSTAVAEDAPMRPVTPYGETKALAEEDTCRRWPTTSSVRRTSAMRRRTARRRGCASTSSLNNLTGDSGDHRQGEAGERRHARGGRSCTSRTSAARAQPFSKRLGSSCTTRRSTSGAARTTSASLTSLSWWPQPYPAPRSSSPRTQAQTCAATRSTSPS